jgi:hypothetical protein
MTPGGSTIDTLRQTAEALRSGDVRESLRAVQCAQDVLDAVKSDLLGQLSRQSLHELDGSSSTKNWVRSQLRLGPTEASRLLRAGDVLRRLPAVAEAAGAGQIRLEHLNVFAYGLKHIGADVVTESIEWLLGVARTSEPGELFAVMKQLRAAIYPDDLDEQWAKGADKAHFSVEPVPLGYHVSGFLPTHIGSKLRLVLDSLSAPRGEDDARSTDQRHVDAVDEIVTSFLESGLPSDQGVRPHLSVRVDADTLAERPGEPATLDGFGPIGPQLLALLACSADVTPVLTRQGFANGSVVLNVGRTRRLATGKQRRAIHTRQDGVCAAPGCRNTHLEIHHVIWWSRGGPTDLDNLIGLCSRCHHLVHREHLAISGDGTCGFTFRTGPGTYLLRQRRRHRIKLVATSPPLAGVA